jgi:hypothetical protein
MSYTNRQVTTNFYYSPYDTVIASSEPEATTTEQVYTKVKEFTLRNSINANSLFRITFSMRRVAGATGVAGRIYVNGVAVGTERTDNALTSYTEDIASTNWKVGDTISIYAKTGSVATTVGISLFYIKGSQQQWENTL